MSKHKNNITSFITKAAFSSIFFVLGFAFLLQNVLVQDFGFSTLPYFHTKRVQQTDRNVFQVEITARENNFGIVAVQFINKRKVRNKTVTFTVQEVQTGKVIYRSTFDPNYFIDHKHHAFGFPPIPDSQNKTYQISLSASDEQIISDLRVKPNTPVISMYASDSSLLKNNPILLVEFVITKIVFYLLYLPHQLQTLFFFIPFIVYLFVSTGLHRFVENGVRNLLSCLPEPLYDKISQNYDNHVPDTPILFASISFPLWITLQVFMYPEYNVLIYSFMVLYLIIITKMYSFPVQTFLYYECFFFLATIIGILLNNDTVAEIFAIWIYTLFWFLAGILIHSKMNKGYDNNL